MSLSTTLEAAVTAVALTYPTPDRGELPEARAERLHGVSVAVVAASRRALCEPPWDLIDAPCKRLWPGNLVSLVALDWSLAYLESGLAEWVHAGRCRVKIGECDAGRARSPWQLQQTSYVRDAWNELEGTGEWSTFQGAWASVRVVSAARSGCGRWKPEVPWLEAAIAGYATGNACVWPRAAKRAAFVTRVESQIRARME